MRQNSVAIVCVLFSLEQRRVQTLQLPVAADLQEGVFGAPWSQWVCPGFWRCYAATRRDNDPTSVSADPEAPETRPRLPEYLPYRDRRNGIPRRSMHRGEQTLTMDDAQAGRRFDDVVYRSGESRALRYSCHRRHCASVDVPYRSWCRRRSTACWPWAEAPRLSRIRSFETERPSSRSVRLLESPAPWQPEMASVLAGSMSRSCKRDSSLRDTSWVMSPA